MSEWIPLSESTPEGNGERLILIWHVFLGCWTDRARNYKANQFYTHWMEAPTEGWTRTGVIQPTEADEDGMHCILVSNDTLTVLRVTGWFQTRYRSEYTRWMHTPEGPANYKELMKLY